MSYAEKVKQSVSARLYNICPRKRLKHQSFGSAFILPSFRPMALAVLRQKSVFSGQAQCAGIGRTRRRRQVLSCDRNFIIGDLEPRAEGLKESGSPPDQPC